MIPILDVLFPDDINLALASEVKSAAILEVLSLLNGDPRILDFEAFCRAVETRNAPAINVHGTGICIAHGRTDTVSSLVLAAGRSDIGISCCEMNERIRLLFVVGIPTAFDNEYLRTVGAIVRACNHTTTLRVLLETKDPIECLNQLSNIETP